MATWYLLSWAGASYLSFWFFDSRGGRKENFDVLSPTAKGVRVIIHIALGYMLYSVVFAILPPSFFE